MNTKTTENHIQAPASASLETHSTPSRGRLLRDLKLMFAALGAGTSVIPMGDNGRTTRQLALYAECLNARP